jgi:membrane-associated protease RseP (regulator of RpoE activity)
MQEEKRRWTLWIVLGVIVALLLGCIMGTMAGGLVGYMAGRATARVQPVPPAPVPETPDRPLRDSGALVVEVVADSPAEQAGIIPGDIILAVEERALGVDYTLAEAIAQHNPDDVILLHISRQGRIGAVQVRLGHHPELDDTAWLGVGYRTIGEMPLNPRMPRGFERPG